MVSPILKRPERSDEPAAAVELYCSFPFGAEGVDDAFGENALRLAAAKLMIKLEMFKDPRLQECLVAVGKHFGGPQYIEKQIDALDAKGLVPLCKAIYCEITGKTEEDLNAAFASKGWVSQDMTRSVNPAQGARLGRRKMM